MKRTFDKDKYKVEPGNIHHIHTLVNFNVANVERTLDNPPCGCTVDDIPDTFVTKKGKAIATYKGKNIYEYQKDITGHVVLAPGFNCGIIKVGSNKELQIIASEGIGASLNEPQEEFEIYNGEAANKPANAYSLAGGIPCSDTVKMVNGLHTPNIILAAGAGISATVEGNTLTIDVDESMLAGSCSDECGN